MILTDTGEFYQSLDGKLIVVQKNNGGGRVVTGIMEGTNKSLPRSGAYSITSTSNAPFRILFRYANEEYQAEKFEKAVLLCHYKNPEETEGDGS